LTTEEAILADMVGEVSFLAEMTAIQAELGTIDASLSAGFSAQLAATIAQTTGTISALSAIGALITSSNTKLDTINSSIIAGNTLLNNINTTISSGNGSILGALATINNNINQMRLSFLEPTGQSVFLYPDYTSGQNRSVFKAWNNSVSQIMSVFTVPPVSTFTSPADWPNLTNNISARPLSDITTLADCIALTSGPTPGSQVYTSR